MEIVLPSFSPGLEFIVNKKTREQIDVIVLSKEKNYYGRVSCNRTDKKFRIYSFGFFKDEKITLKLEDYRECVLLSFSISKRYLLIHTSFLSDFVLSLDVSNLITFDDPFVSHSILGTGHLVVNFIDALALGLFLTLKL